MKDKEKQIEFKVIDNNTGKEADIGKIALKEDWAKGLMYCDMQGFAISDDGNLVLLDECGKFEYCPSERFSIKFEDSVVLSREEYEKLTAPRLFIKQKPLREKELAEKLKNANYGIIGVDESSIEIIPTRAEIEKEMAKKILNKVDKESNGQTKQITDLIRKQSGVEIKE